VVEQREKGVKGFFKPLILDGLRLAVENSGYFRRRCQWLSKARLFSAAIADRRKITIIFGGQSLVAENAYCCYACKETNRA
jgi:hypothetical protein